MIRMVTMAVLLLAATPVFAADGWSAQIEDDEGGPAMVASIAGEPDGKVTPMLRLLCDGPGKLMLRYETAADMVEPGSEADFLFENESSQATVHMVYEEMDGAFAAYFPRTDTLVALLQNGEDVFISETSGNYRAQTFSLHGSTKAMTTLLKTCG